MPGAYDTVMESSREIILTDINDIYLDLIRAVLYRMSKEIDFIIDQ
ncbi:2479_t:CDS:2 [Racocetra fulgida]|uniref:2479_t:CDS:1 n=1 Tax=Racocetra fulgida TaxID=60492 RepID=A0A9N9AXS1_9GLOM|nr:2479_t:CDS:2 [Racocetra fulgida]